MPYIYHISLYGINDLKLIKMWWYDNKNVVISNIALVIYILI